jgi:hypothetical protein
VDKTNIILTATIALFAIVQGMAAFNQHEMQKRKYRSQAANDELEKGYGPINAILGKPNRQGEDFIELHISEKREMDERLSTYFYMFPANLADYWVKNLQKTKPTMSNDPLAGAHDLIRGNFSVASGLIDVYKIPLEFVQMFKTEYAVRVQKMNLLLTQ